MAEKSSSEYMVKKNIMNSVGKQLQQRSKKPPMRMRNMTRARYSFGSSMQRMPLWVKNSLTGCALPKEKKSLLRPATRDDC